MIVDGEELIGAKQNRIVNLTILVPARSRIHLPVSCVEAGRWHHRTRHFGTAPRTHYASGRAMKARAVTESYRMVGRPVSDQGAIWDDIARKSERLLAHSDTSAMDVMYDGSASELRHFEAHFEPVAGADGRRLPDRRRADRPRPLRLAGHVAEARAEARRELRARRRRPGHRRGRHTRAALREGSAAEDLLARVRELRVERYPSAGLGEDFRLSGPSLAGGALVVEEALVHLAVFPR